MKKLILLFILPLMGLWSCQSDLASKKSPSTELTSTDNLSTIETVALQDDTDTVSVKVMMQEHSVRLMVNKEDVKQAHLSPASIKALETWWDSLPKPLQSQIKSNQVEIELVSKFRSSDENRLSPRVTDSHIENTGAMLERIIGTSTDMTFSVSTTILDKDATAQLNEEHSTNINLVKKVPMKLSQFSTDIPLNSKNIDNQNIQALQYWWNSLPEDLKEKVKRRELLVDLTCTALDKGLDKNQIAVLNDNAEGFSMLMTDVLHQMIGYYTVQKKQYPLARINTEHQVEKISGAQSPTSSEYSIKIQLKNNKSGITVPSM